MSPAASPKGARIATILSLMWLQLACSSGATDGVATGGPMSGRGGATASSIRDASTSLAFDPPSFKVGTLDRVTVGLRVVPARSQIVKLALVGSSLDASLDSMQVVTDAEGVAVVGLLAPSQPTSFSVRGSVDRGMMGEASVEVSQSLTGALDIGVTYAGSRRVDKYAVSLYPDEDCTSSNLVVGNVNRISLPLTSTLPIRATGLPRRRSVAVVVDGDRTVHGCAVAPATTDDTSAYVGVPLQDLPLDLHGTTLDLLLTGSEGSRALQDLVAPSVTTFVDSLVTGNHDLLALLDAMGTAALGSLHPEFEDLRKSSNWDSIVVESYAEAGGSDLLRRQLRGWLNKGQERLVSQPIMELRLQLEPRDYSAPKVELTRLAGIDGTTNLFVQESSLAVDASVGDRLNWSANLRWNHANLLDLLVLASASETLPGASDVPALLARVLDCNSFGALLDQNAVWLNPNLRVCFANCLVSLCRSALAAMYQRSTNAVVGFGTPTTLFISAAGDVTVDANATPVSSTGTWIGSFSAKADPLTMSGTYASR